MTGGETVLNRGRNTKGRNVHSHALSRQTTGFQIRTESLHTIEDRVQSCSVLSHRPQMCFHRLHFDIELDVDALATIKGGQTEKACKRYGGIVYLVPLHRPHTSYMSKASF
jgi:hypothetical protein